MTEEDGTASALEKLQKKQKQFHRTVTASLDKTIATLSAALACPDDDARRKLLADAALVSGPLADIHATTKDYYAAFGKLSKAIDKKFASNLDAAAKEGAFDGRSDALHAALASHFVREGEFELASALAQDVGLPLPKELNVTFSTLHTLLESIKKQQLDAAIDWANQHRQDLDKQNSPLLFLLHRYRFLQMVQSGDIIAAILYARHHFGPFRNRFRKELERLMGCLAYASPSSAYKENIHSSSSHLLTSPYADLLSPSHFQTLLDCFTKDYCRLHALTPDPPLQIITNIGAQSVPVFIKVNSVLSSRLLQSDQLDSEIPIDVALPKEHHYHTTFRCPVSREATTASNPPMMLVCGHVVGKESMVKLVKGVKVGTVGSGNKLKCPYCPVESLVGQALQISF